MLHQRSQLLEIYLAGLSAVQGETTVYKALATRAKREPCYVLAIGKAAESMFQGARRYYADEILKALVITKKNHSSAALAQLPKVEVIEAAHPIPDDSSLKAGEYLVHWLQTLPTAAPLVCLVSGGTSSLVEVLSEDWTLARLQAKTSDMLANGDSILAINAQRKRLSRIKGGRLWDYVGKRNVTCLLISDIPHDDPSMIGSGLLFPAPADAEFYFEIVASNQACLKAMQQAAEQRQLPVTVMPTFMEGNAETTAVQCIEFLRQTAPGLYLWGAETTVILPANPGQGGRNQHLALAAALQLQADETITLLAAGTDGTDGVTEDTGALVDNQTITRGKQENLDPNACLAQADAGTFLQASGDLIYTGPTGTNVMDIIMGLKG